MKSLFTLTALCLLPIMMSAQSDQEPQRCIDCHLPIMDNDVQHEVAVDDCETCHMANGNAHPQEGVTGFDLGETVPALCFMCHDEHTRSNIHPPAEEECLMCHSPHSSPNKALLINAPQAVLCSECHDMEMTEKKYRHKPLEKGKCSDCHDPHQSDASSLLKAEKPGLCMNCHGSVQMQTVLRHQHPPFEDDCANCHETHSADTTKLLFQATPGLCYNCHDMEESIKSAAVVHGVINDEKSCVNCHSPHASEQAFLLTKTGKDHCLDCHSRTIQMEDRTLANIGKLLKKGNLIHGAIELDGCTVCHLPHASDYASLLNAAFPADQYTEALPEHFDLCFTCHDAELMTAEVTTTATNFRNGFQNLHHLHINGQKGRNCNLCHNVHGSPNAHLIATKVQFGNWEMPVEYKADAEGGSCNTGCHAEKRYTR